MHNYTIIGLGWLGSPLAAHLVNAGHAVAGTTRCAKKAAKLARQGIKTALFDLYENAPSDLGSDIFHDAKVIINIPPGRKNFEPARFIERMKALFDYAVQHRARHICFISTTSVFGGMEGQITNDSALTPNTPSGNAHVELELYLKDLARAFSVDIEQHEITQPELNKHNAEVANISGCSCSVLRLAGLIGKDRHPITTLSQKSNIALGKNPVNLVHQQDVIQVIVAVLSYSDELSAARYQVKATKNPFQAGFYAANLCSSEHPTREQYYVWCAEQKGIQHPRFASDNREKANGKWVDAEQTIKGLGVTLYYPSPYNMLE